MSEYLDKSGLAYFWGKIRSCIDDIVDTIDNKVDKEAGKGLSTNDYTTAEKNAVATIGDKVPTTRKVNGKALSADITLGGDDINVAIGAISGTLNTFLATIDGDIEHLTEIADGLAEVASSGSYNDLTDKPTIPAAITVDSSLSSTSTNPVQNKVINTALSGKASANSVPNAATIDSSGLITFKNGSTNLFTLQLPVYSGSSSTIPSASGVSF